VIRSVPMITIHDGDCLVFWGTLALLVTLGVMALAARAAAASADPCVAFREALTATRKLIQEAPFRDRDPSGAELFLETNVSAAFNDALAAADRDRPLLGRGDHRTNLGLPNPDNVYWLARIEPGVDYRIVGKRGTSADLTFQLLDGYPGTGTLGTNAGLLRSKDLAVEPDGSFEIFVGPTPHAGNRLAPILAGADTLVIRETFQDWEKERPGTYRLERVGVEKQDVEPSATELREALVDAASILRAQSTVYVRFVAELLGLKPPDPGTPASRGLPPNFLSPPVQTKSGLPGQRSSLAHFVLEEGQVMVVTVAPSRFPYQGFEVGNLWFQTFDWARHQSSLTTAQARRDADGLYRFVLSPTDPGVPNWLDTVGQREGFAFLRWQGLDEDLPQEQWPQVEIVSLAELRERLPGDTPVVTPEERKRSVAERERAVARRYAETAEPVREIVRRIGALDRAVAPECQPSSFLPAFAFRTSTLDEDVDPKPPS